ncbi:DUF2188 domain-containing protein [Rubrivirga sp.]|uniref:DUF2188 domain-containing protein n=1 Tax=Rubrivirga sp. TaxID=1885344 RepID=UPI003B5175F4
MANSNVYHVVPREERWGVRLEGSPTLSFETDDREAAVDRAAGYVRQLGAGRVVVHSDSGQIETVHTFDQLPAPQGGWLDAVLSQPVYLAVGAAALVALGVGLSRRS